jgi:hypothetical protein
MNISSFLILQDYLPYQKHTPLSQVAYGGREYTVYEVKKEQQEEDISIIEKIQAIFIKPSYSKEEKIEQAKKGIISQEAHQDKDVYLAYFQHAPLATPSDIESTYQFAHSLIKEDKEVALAAVTRHAKNLRHVSDSFKNDEDIVLAAVKQRGDALEYAASALKKNKAIVWAAFNQSPTAFSYADPALKDDKSFVVTAVCLNGLALKYTDMRQDREVALAAIRQTAEVWNDLTPQFRAEEDFAIAALHHKSSLFFTLSSQLKSLPQVVAAAHESLSQQLSSLAKDPLQRQRLLEFTQFLLDSLIEYQLPEQHPLVQQIIESHIVALPSDDLKNPYVLHQKIQTALKEEELFVDFEGFRKRAKAHKGFTFADIPTDLFSFETLFDSIEKRGIQPQEVASLCNGATLEELKENILGFNKLIPSILAQKGKLQDPIPLTNLYLYLVLKAICQEDDIRIDEQLSNREIRLLKFAGMVKDCKTGQADAIEQYYIYTVDKAGLRQEQTKIEAVVDRAIQIALKKALASEKFLQELIGMKKVGQQAHQTLYLKNRYHKQIGLHHSLEFDSHTNALDETLLKKETKDVLKLIQKHLELEKEVKAALDRALQAPTTISYLKFTQYFETKLGLKGEYENYFEFDIDSNPIGITLLAVKKILDYLGLIT